MAKAKRTSAEFQSQHVEIGTAKIENPLWSRDHYGDRTNPRFIDAKVNVRESGVSVLASRGSLDEAQVLAADRFRLLWEQMGGAGAGALDYSKEPVDGGAAIEPIRASALNAGLALSEAENVLRKAYGEYAYKLVGYVAGQGHSVHDLTVTRRQRDTMTDNLRMYLDELAVLWGYRKFAQQRRAAVR